MSQNEQKIKADLLEVFQNKLKHKIKIIAINRVAHSS
jgi:hypothetical protein